jgi:hypothetical protein
MRETDPEKRSVQGVVENLGQRLLYDDFEGVFKWKEAEGYGLATGSKNASTVFDKNYSMALSKNRVLANGIIYYYMGRTFQRLTRGVIRVETVFKFNAPGGIPPFNVTECPGITFGVEIRDPDKIKMVLLELNTQSNVAYVFTPPIVKKLVGTIKLKTEYLGWHRSWIVYDVGKDIYVECGLDGEKFSVSGLSSYPIAGAYSLKSTALAGVGTYDPGTARVFYDNFMVIEV